MRRSQARNLLVAALLSLPFLATHVGGQHTGPRGSRHDGRHWKNGNNRKGNEDDRHRNDDGPDSSFSSDSLLDEQALQAVRILVQPRKPRGLFDGIWKASKSTTRGFLLGTTSIFTFPIVTAMTLGTSNTRGSLLLMSTMLGALFGMGAIFLGMWNGLFHCAWGLLQLLPSLSSWWRRGCAWNPERECWESYDLEEEWCASRVDDDDDDDDDDESSFYSDEDQSDGLSYYQLLQVDRTASKYQIRRAYRRAAKRWHPDKNPSSTAMEDFLMLTEAHRILSDDAARTIYDVSGGGGNGKSPMDLKIFFAILLDSYEVLRPYTGELPMVYWASALARSGFLQAETDEDAAATAAMETAIQILANSKRTASKRRVEIAVQLRDDVEPFTSGAMSEDDFRLLAACKARRILRDGAIGARQQGLIGRVMKDSASSMMTPVGIFRRLVRWPKKAVAGAQAAVRSEKQKCHLLWNSFRLFKHCNSSQGHISEEGNEYERYSRTTLIQFMRVVQGLNELDIFNTIDGAVWRVVHDAGVSPNERFLRARALEILGEELLKISSVYTNEDSISAIEDDLDRVSIAAYLANESSEKPSFENLSQQVRKDLKESRGQDNLRTEEVLVTEMNCMLD